MRSCYRRLHEPNSGHICHMRCLHSLQGHVLVSGRWVLTVNVLIQQWDRCPGFFHPVPFISKAIWICKEHQTEAVLVCLGGRDPQWWPQSSVLRKQDPFSSCSQQPDNAGTPGSVLCHSPTLFPLLGWHTCARPCVRTAMVCLYISHQVMDCTDVSVTVRHCFQHFCIPGF